MAPTTKEDVCGQHSGCIADIKNLKDNYMKHDQTIEVMKSRINLILGGVCMSCILLVVNLVVKP